MSANKRATRAETFKEQFDAEFDVEDEHEANTASTVDDCSPLCMPTTIE